MPKTEGYGENFEIEKPIEKIAINKQLDFIICHLKFSVKLHNHPSVKIKHRKQDSKIWVIVKLCVKF